MILHYLLALSTKSLGLYCAGPQSDYCIKVTISKHISYAATREQIFKHVTKKPQNTKISKYTSLEGTGDESSKTSTPNFPNARSETKRPTEFSIISHYLCDLGEDTLKGLSFFICQKIPLNDLVSST